MLKPPRLHFLPTMTVFRPSVGVARPSPIANGQAPTWGGSALQQQWAKLFCEFDVVVCPSISTPAFLHDHTPVPDRKLEIDGQDCSFFDQLVWPEIATTPGLPATAAPIGLSADGLPIGVQIVGPYLEDRTPLAFAALIEREFGGFMVPPGYGDLKRAANAESEYHVQQTFRRRADKGVPGT